MKQIWNEIAGAVVDAEIPVDEARLQVKNYYNVLSTMASCRTLRQSMATMVSAFLLSDIVPATQFLDMPTNTHALESL